MLLHSQIINLGQWSFELVSFNHQESFISVLSIVIMEVLSRMIERAVQEGCEVVISHLLYVNTAIAFGVRM